MDNLQASEREQLLNQELARYLALLIEHDEPEKIIVFGSLATGDIHSWSDIDLVIIKQTELPFLQRLHRVRRLLHPKVGTDCVKNDWQPNITGEDALMTLKVSHAILTSHRGNRVVLAAGY